MAVSGHLLVLLIPVLSLCGATEYYVRPTEPTNTSCPAQPCLTLNQYVNDSDHYFQSNTVFKFLPGTHHMDRPVTIGNVHNMSLESFSNEYPHLVVQFSCETKAHKCLQVSAWKYQFDVCCAAIWLSDIHNVTVKGVNVTVQTPNVSGIILTNVSKVSIHFTTTYSSYDHYCFGIAIFEAASVEVHSSTTNNCTFGFMLEIAVNSHISDITAMYNMWGMVLVNVNNSSISNTFVTRNSLEGVFLGYMKNIHFNNTTATYNGVSGMHLLNMNNTYIINTTTTHNSENGMLLDTMENVHIASTTATLNSWEGMLLQSVNNAHITDATVTLNGGDGYYGGAASSGQITVVFSKHILIYNSSFTEVNTPISATTADPDNLPAIIVLDSSTLHISECHFTRNHISAIRGGASNITVSGNLVFSGNTAFAGTAFILAQDSILKLRENSHIYFLSNHALVTGGVFYIDTNINYNYNLNSVLSRSTNCFLHVEGSRSQQRFAFVNNTAGEGGDILYGGDVALGLDGQWNCLDSFKNISNISQNGLSLISSDPSRVCLCNGTGQPDCLTLADPTPNSIYPGQSTNISAVVVGQDFGTVAGSVYAQFLPISPPESSPQLESLQTVQPVTQQHCSQLYYTILTQSEISEAVLVLTSHKTYVSKYVVNTSTDPTRWQSHYNTSATGPLIYRNNPVYVNISLLPCPPGFMLTTRPPFRCDCDRLLQQMQEIQCHIQDQTIGRSGQLWVGMIQEDNGTNGTLAASKYCSLNYCNQEESNVTLSKPDSQCNFNHSGVLCGGCQPGLSLALGSAQCLPCSNKYLALLIPFTLAGPILVGVIKLLDLTISQGTLNGLIFYANIVKAYEYVLLPHEQTNLLTVFIAWLNLDLGVETCFFNGLSAYSKTWLQFVFPLYIWSIAGLIIILAKYSEKVSEVTGNNSVPLLATLIFLSYAKIFRTIITALSYTVVYTSHGQMVVWTADGNVDYLGSKHIPLFAAAVAILLFLWLPYTLLLFLRQWLHMSNSRLISYILNKIKPFLDTHSGSLKGKHRYWFGALLLVRAVILLIQALVPADHASTVVLCISVSAIVLTYYGQLVYCNLAVSVFDTAFFMNLALLTVANLFANTVGEDPTVAAYILIGIVFLQFVGLVLFKFFSVLKQNARMMEYLHKGKLRIKQNAKIMACLHKGQLLIKWIAKVIDYFYKKQPTEDDWEAFEEAARLRETESALGQQNRDDRASYESIVSLSTY